MTTNVDGVFDALDDDPFEPPAVVEFVEGMMSDERKKKHVPNGRNVPLLGRLGGSLFFVFLN